MEVRDRTSTQIIADANKPSLIAFMWLIATMLFVVGIFVSIFR